MHPRHKLGFDFAKDVENMTPQKLDFWFAYHVDSMDPIRGYFDQVVEIVRDHHPKIVDMFANFMSSSRKATLDAPAYPFAL